MAFFLFFKVFRERSIPGKEIKASGSIRTGCPFSLGFLGGRC